MKPIPLLLALVFLGIGLFLWLQPDGPSTPSLDPIQLEQGEPAPVTIEVPLDTSARESARSSSPQPDELPREAKPTAPARILGTVVTQEGHPAPDAEVLLAGLDTDPGEPVIVFPDGSFEIEIDPRWSALRLHARHPDFAPSAERSVDLKAPPSELSLRLGGPGAGVIGIVIDTFGDPIEGAVIELGQPRIEASGDGAPPGPGGGPTGTLLTDGSSAGVAPPLRVLSNEQGRFAAQGLAAEWMPVHASAEEHLPVTVAVIPTVEAPAPLRLELSPSGRIEGIVYDSEGQTVEDASIVARPISDSARAPWGASTRSDAQGRFVLSPLESGPHGLFAESPGRGVAGLEVDVLPGRAVHREVRLGPPGSSGCLLRSDGNVLAGWSVGLVLSDTETLGRSPTDGDGRFQLPADPDPDPATRGIAVWDPTGIRRPLADDVQTGPDLESDLELRVDVLDCPSAWIRGRLASAEGRAPSGARLRVHEQLVQHGVEYPLESSSTDAAVESKAFRIGPLLPGPLRLDGLGPGFGAALLAEVELDVDGDHDLGDLVWPGTGQLEIRLIAEDRAFERSLYYMILQKQGEVASDLVDGAGAPPSPLELWPGTYEIALFSDGYLAPEVTVEVRADGSEQVDIELRPGARYGFTVTLSGGDEPSGPVEVNWIQRGATHPLHTRWLEGPPFSGRVDLEVGSYRVVASSDQGRGFEDFEWTGEPQAAPRTIVLRPELPPESDDDLDDF